MKIRILILLLLSGFSFSQGEGERLKLFEQVWRLVWDRDYDSTFNGHDWLAIGERYRLLAAKTESNQALYDLMDQMYGELEDDHSRVLDPVFVERRMKGMVCQPVPFLDPFGTKPPAANPTSPEIARPVPARQGPSLRELMGSADYDPAGVRVENGYVIIRFDDLVDPSSPSLVGNAIRANDKTAKGYILDLRGNPGGLALQMGQIAGYFMRGFPWRIVSRGLGATPFPTIPFFGKPATSKPLVVLIDGNVNSAAEGLAGALKDAKRAYLIGTTTAGNTEVLTPYCLEDGGIALVANGILAPFSGRTWEGRGVEPDLVVEDPTRQLLAAFAYLSKTK